MVARRRGRYSIEVGGLTDGVNSCAREAVYIGRSNHEIVRCLP
jgi:hypothetical protein